MKVPWIWKIWGWFLIVVPLIGLVGLLRLVMEFGFSEIFSIMGVLMWISLSSVVFSVIVGVLLIRGSIWGYHLTKVLMVISVINILFLVFDFETKTIVYQIIRIIILGKVLYSNATKIYLSELRNNKRVLV